MTTRLFPDGLLEIAWSGNSREPGFVGQSQMKSSFRVDGGEWEHAGRSMHRIIEAMECADSVVEFRQYLEGAP